MRSFFSSKFVQSTKEINAFFGDIKLYARIIVERLNDKVLPTILFARLNVKNRDV